jgi:protein involved in polysaccharide export with SLBB domain
VSRANGVQAEIIRVPIDSSFLFDRKPGEAYDAPPGDAAGSAGRGEFVLKPYDVVNVLRQPDFEYLGTVTLQGEVRFPGQYAISRRGEKLRDVIARAGGLTTVANADAAVFRRRLTPAERVERARVLQQMKLGAATSTAATPAGLDGIGTTISSEAAMQYRNAVDSFLQQSGDSADRVSVDLVALIRNTNSRDDLELRAGDVLEVPTLNPVVSIIGFVQSPASMPLVPGEPLTTYIERGGGQTPSGSAEHAYVIQPNGAVESFKHRWWLIPDRNPVPRAGATVIVPQRDLGDRKQSLVQQVAPLLQLVASFVAIIAVVKR